MQQLHRIKTRTSRCSLHSKIYDRYAASIDLSSSFVSKHSNFSAENPEPYRNIFTKMLIAGDSNENPQNPSKKEAETTENGEKNETLFSPRFRSVAAMAGWDEEALLIASLIVEDTPDRQFKHKKRSELQSLKTPPTNSRRKRRAQRRSPAKIPATVLDLDEDEPKSKRENEKTNNKQSHSFSTEEAENRGDDEVNTNKGSYVSSSTPPIPCIDRLREELSCAICLEICYEPSTTPCGHSFCKKCLKSAADKCGKKCPKCRQFVSNGRYCTVNTVLWNTIQLLFPQEVEARKAVASASTSASNSSEAPQSRTPPRTRSHNTRNRPVMALLSPEPENDTVSDRRRNHGYRTRSGMTTTMMMSRRGGGDVRMRRELPSQDVDALALRLQREEFMEAFRSEGNGNSLATARANLRAMASRAINIRVVRGRTD